MKLILEWNQNHTMTRQAWENLTSDEAFQPPKAAATSAIHPTSGTNITMEFKKSIKKSVLDHKDFT